MPGGDDLVNLTVLLLIVEIVHFHRVRIPQKALTLHVPRLTSRHTLALPRLHLPLLEPSTERHEKIISMPLDRTT